MKSRFVGLSYAFIAVLYQMRGLRSDTTSSPSDTTALLGQNVTLSCEFPPTNSSYFVKWIQVQTNGSNFDIFKSPPDKLLSDTSKPGKFAINGSTTNGSYDLMINNVNFSDAGTYECQFTGWPNDISKMANLVVIDPRNFTLSLAPPSAVYVRNSTLVNCSLRYSAPAENYGNKPLTLAQRLVLNVSLDGVPLSSTVTTYTLGVGYYVRTAIVNYTVQPTDDGKLFQCLANSLTYNQSITRSLSVYSAPSRISITPQVELSSNINDTFNCSANGYPAPTVFWTPLTDRLTQQTASSDQTSGYSLLKIVDSINPQNWLCNATNKYGSTSVSILINVTSAPDPGKVESSGVDAVALGVGIGVGLGVPILVALIVLIVCLVSRRKRSQKEVAMKSASQTAAAVGTGQPSSQVPPPPYSTVNLNPSGARNNRPIYEGQTDANPLSPPSSRPTSGYGHLGITGVNPSLNGSFVSDHSAVRPYNAVVAPTSNHNSDAGSTYRYVPRAGDGSNPSLVAPQGVDPRVLRSHNSSLSSAQGISLDEDNFANHQISDRGSAV